MRRPGDIYNSMPWWIKPTEISWAGVGFARGLDGEYYINRRGQWYYAGSSIDNGLIALGIGTYEQYKARRNVA